MQYIQQPLKLLCLFRNSFTLSSKRQSVIQRKSLSICGDNACTEIEKQRQKLFHSLKYCVNDSVRHYSVKVNATKMSEEKTVKVVEEERADRTTPLKLAPVIKSSPRPATHFYRRVLPDVCIGFGSEEGKNIFKETLPTGYMECYFGLAAQFRTQDEPAFCGLSSLVMALNSLEVDPKRIWKGVWRWYHEYMLDCCVPLKVVEAKGVTLDQLACLAACNTLNVRLHYGKSPHTEEEFRSDVKAVTMTTDQVLIVSYSRKTLQQTGDGHFSPIAGYHADRDLVLILDTARFKYPPYWVPLSLLWRSMTEKDKETGQPRGYMVVKKNDSIPLMVFKISPLMDINMAANKEVKVTVTSFLESWNGWLQSSREDVQATTDRDIWQLAIEQLGASLGLLDGSILTTQVGMKCDLSSEHSCIVAELLHNLEKTSLFKTVSESESTSRLNQPNLNDCDQCNITADHYLTTLLLAWPYCKCRGSRARKLAELSTQLLVESGPVLRDEVTSLRQQLESMMGFMKKCLNCNCGL